MLGALTCCATLTQVSSHAAVFAKGADVGWLSQLEANPYTFYNNAGVAQDCLQILKDKGINSIRLRVWVNPTGGWCGKTDVVNMAIRAKNLGMRLMIDFHYSDSWADPGKQTKPAAWSTHTYAQLQTDVYNHTYDVLNTLKTNGVTPEWVQVGNEVNGGMLWPEGSTSNMSQFAGLINQGYNAVKAVSSTTKVIVHCANAYDNANFRWIFDGLTANGAHFDVIGMSHYPSPTSWTTTNAQAQTNLNDMAARYTKDVMICEVGLDWQQPDVCAAMLTDIMNKVKAVPSSHGLGAFYWEPEAVPGWQGYTLGALGSNNRPTPAMDAFLYDVPGGANLVTNGTFEASAATQTPTGWTTWANTGNADADYTEAGGHAGSYRLSHWKATAYQVSTSQVKTGLVNGTYTLRAWVRNSGGQTVVQLYAKNFGGTEKDYQLPVYGNWVQIQLPGINVTNGQCEIGLWSNANGGNWANIDDVEFVKN